MGLSKWHCASLFEFVCHCHNTFEQAPPFASNNNSKHEKHRKMKRRFPCVCELLKCTQLSYIVDLRGVNLNLMSQC